MTSETDDIHASWRRRAETSDFIEMGRLATEIFNSSYANDPQRTAARTAMNAINAVLGKGRVSEKQIFYARSRFASLKIMI